MARVDRIERNGESRRRFFLIAEVTFSDREASPRDEDDHNYYTDDDLREVFTAWVDNALDDRDDGPDVRFLEIPRILDVDVESIARGDYPRSAY